MFFVFVKVTNNGKRHSSNVSFGTSPAARVTGRTRANAIHARQQAMASVTDRSFDAGTLASTCRRQRRHVSTRATLHATPNESIVIELSEIASVGIHVLLDESRSLAVLGGDAVVFMGDYK